MDTFLLRIYQSEVALQCKFVLFSADALSRPANHDAVWYFLQNLLVSSASLSKMLWGSGDRLEAARALLRESLAVSDESPLRDRKLRNDFEHFDSRLDQWFSEDSHHNFVGRNIGRFGSIRIGDGEQDSRRFQHYDPAAGIVTFWEHSVSVPEVVAEVERILPVAEREARKPHWD